VAGGAPTSEAGRRAECLECDNPTLDWSRACVRQQVAGKAAAGSGVPVKRRKRLTGGPRWIFIFERKVKSAVF
jgi:hypothetical protein